MDTLITILIILLVIAALVLIINPETFKLALVVMTFAVILADGLFISAIWNAVEEYHKAEQIKQKNNIGEHK